MIFRPGTKCVMNEGLFGHFLRHFGEDKIWHSEVYVVLKYNPLFALVLLADEHGKPFVVLDSWIVPLKDTVWHNIKNIIAKSTGPDDLLKRLRETPDGIPPKHRAVGIPASLPVWRRALVKIMDWTDLLLSTCLNLWISLIRFMRMGITYTAIPNIGDVYERYSANK